MLHLFSTISNKKPIALKSRVFYEQSPGVAPVYGSFDVEPAKLFHKVSDNLAGQLAEEFLVLDSPGNVLQ